MAMSSPPTPDLPPTQSPAQSLTKSPPKSPSRSPPKSPIKSPLKYPIKPLSQEYPDSPTITPQLEPPGEEPPAPVHEEPDTMTSDSRIDQGQQLRSQVRTPDPQIRRSQAGGQTNGHRANVQTTPSTPGHLPPFDWEDLESRYEQALADANEQDKELLEEFDRLVKYFNVWASAASAHDNERAVKRLQTRERFVKISEQSLDQRKRHLTEVVRAFQSALALLSQS